MRALAPPGTNPRARAFFPYQIGEQHMGKGILLWLIGVPIPVIIILWLLFR